MGPVQSDQDDEPRKRGIDIHGVRIEWDDHIEQLSGMYGPLVLDYFKGLFGARLHVGFAGVRC
jgi:hypothetical protein